MRLFPTLILAGATLVAACQPDTPAPSPEAVQAVIDETPKDLPKVIIVERNGPDPCGSADYLILIGHPQSRLGIMTFPRGTRIITPGMAVTKDYRPNRLNFDIDADGKIARVYCG